MERTYTLCIATWVFVAAPCVVAAVVAWRHGDDPCDEDLASKLVVGAAIFGLTWLYMLVFSQCVLYQYFHFWEKKMKCHCAPRTLLMPLVLFWVLWVAWGVVTVEEWYRTDETCEQSKELYRSAQVLSGIALLVPGVILVWA